MAAKHYEFAPMVKNSVDMRDVLRRYGLEPDRHGYIRCPFHTEKTGSMKVWPDHYKCFGCGVHGDVIDFVQRYEHTEFAEAMEILNRDFGLGLPLGSEPTPLRLLRERQKAAHRADEARIAQRLRELKAEHVAHLTAAWADYDATIKAHPVPDNEKTAHAYQMRDHIGYLINEADGETEENDDLQPTRRDAG